MTDVQKEKILRSAIRLARAYSKRGKEITDELTSLLRHCQKAGVAKDHGVV